MRKKITGIPRKRFRGNANGKRFNRTYRTEVLDNFAFENLHQARMLTLAWMWIYNNERPHSSLGYRSPVKFLESRLDPGDFPTLQKEENGVK